MTKSETIANIKGAKTYKILKIKLGGIFTQAGKTSLDLFANQ